ncbi:MAG: GGDEF domain-containing protein [Planctomycetota bacterium]
MGGLDAIKFNNPEPGLFTYAQILHLLKIEFSRARRYQYPLAALLLQIDRLENLKDLYGYRMRDTVQDQVVAVISQHSRASDFLGKLGERLIMILPHTDGEGAQVIARRIQDQLGRLTFEIDEREINITVSIGIAVMRDQSTIFFDALIQQAESALLRVTERGGNGILVYVPTDDPSRVP